MGASLIKEQVVYVHGKMEHTKNVVKAVPTHPYIAFPSKVRKSDSCLIASFKSVPKISNFRRIESKLNHNLDIRYFLMYHIIQAKKYKYYYKL